MKKDIEIPKVEDVHVAVVKELNEEKTAEEYNVYLINYKKESLENVMVSSRGYGVDLKTNEKIQTSALRHFIGTVEGREFARIELIMQDLFKLNNEYWVSFYIDGQIYDKKFVFLAESIKDENMIDLSVIEKKGVLI